MGSPPCGGRLFTMRPLPNHLIPRSPGLSGERLAAIAADFGTPVFAYDADLIELAWDVLRGALPIESELYYSVKANPALGVVDEFRRLGAGFEVATAGEMATLQRSGVAAVQIIMIGPGKRDEDLRRAVESAIGLVVVESRAEVLRVDALAQTTGRRMDLALRLNLLPAPDLESGRRGLLSMGGQTQFGMTVDEARLVLRGASRHPGVRIIGVHAYLGAAILDARRIVSNTRSILATASALQAETKSCFSFVGLGGGFGVPCYAGDEPLGLQRMRSQLQSAASKYLTDHPDSKRLIFESGRFLMARCGVLVCRVIDVKSHGGSCFVILDGGVGAVGGRDGYLGARAMPIEALDASGPPRVTTLCGPLCTPADRVAAGVAFPEVKPGALVAIHLAGAYGLTASAGLFLSHGSPAEVMIRNSEARLIRQRTTPDQILLGQRTWEESD